VDLEVCNTTLNIATSALLAAFIRGLLYLI
jgi:hypothetical protein